MLHLIDGSGYYEHLRLFATHADRTRFDLTFASVAPAGRLQEDAASWNVSSFALGASDKAALPLAAARLARQLRRRRIDVVQTHLLMAGLVGTTAGRIARTPLLVATAHHPHEIMLTDNARLQRVDTLLHRRLAHRVISPTTWMAEQLIAQERVRPERVTVIPHGLETDRLESTKEGIRGVREQLGLEGRTVLGTIGRIHWIKDHLGLLRAFASLVPRHPDLSLLIVGPGDPTELQRAAAELNVADRVITPGLRVDMGNVFGAIDVVVQPAMAESFGLAIVEAMLAAKPLVSTAVGVAPDVIEHNRTGLLVQPGDERALADAIEDLLGRRADWDEIGARARRRVEGMTPDIMVKAHEAAYLEWLARPRMTFRYRP